jgi:hypothetical protein
MDHAEMDAADFRGIIVDEGYRTFAESTPEAKLLADFAFHRVVVGGLIEMEKVFIGVIDVATDADGGFRYESLLAGFCSPCVVKDSIAVHENRVRNDLLERGVLFRRRSRNKKIVLFEKKSGKVILHSWAQALEASQFVKKISSYDQHLFHSSIHDQRH